MLVQEYVDELMSPLESGKTLRNAAIIEIIDGSVLAASSGFPKWLEPSEFQVLNACLDNVRLPSWSLGGTQYITSDNNGDVLVGRNIQGGAVAKKLQAKLIALIGIFEDPVTQEECVMLVQKVSANLVKNGY
ncbi:unnamed protein product [Calypogeia fissa]